MIQDAVSRSRVVIVTGAGSGIGQQIAAQAGSAGYSVVLWDIDAEGLQRTERSVRDEGGTALSSVIDVSSRDQVSAGLDEASDVFGTPRLLVNNAGPRSSEQLEFDDGVRAALGSVHLVTELWLERSPAPDPVVVNIASVAGTMTGAGNLWYGASKAGIAGYTRVLAVTRPHGLRANAIAPGIIATPRTEDLLKSDMAAEYQKRNPMRRTGTPSDIAGAVMFLLSDESSYINGVLLPIDGGATVVL